MIEIPYVKDFFKSIKETSIDDLVDRINYYWTTWILTFFAIATGGKQLFGEPIQCMMPAEYPGTWNNYVREFCYVTSTYAEPITSTSGVAEKEKSLTHGYYQWVPFILIIQAFLMYLPHLVWKAFQRNQSIDFQYVVDQSKALRFNMGEERQKVMKDIIAYLSQRLQYQGIKHGMSYAGFGRKSSLLHLFSKVLTVVVILCQLHFMNACFGNAGDPYWGLTMFKNALTDNGWKETGVFPRVTFCDFNQPIIGGNYPSRTVQCVLMVNMINEKIFVFMWFWLAFVLVLSILNIFYVAAALFIPCFRQISTRYYVKNGLSICCANTSTTGNMNDDKMIEDADRALGPDGIHLLHFIRTHSGGQVATEVACSFIDDYCNSDARQPSQMNDSFNNGINFGEKQGKSHC